MLFRSVSLSIGLRYLRAKRRNHFISFITLASILGLALGVCVLITVLSVMNGFDTEIEKRVFNMVPAITLINESGSIDNWTLIRRVLKQEQTISAAAPFVAGQTLLSYDGSVAPSLVIGILPKEEQKVLNIFSNKAALEKLQPGAFQIVLGAHLAETLHVVPGDSVMVVTPKVSVSPLGMTPRFKRFVVAGIFEAGQGFGFDKGLGFIHLSDAEKLFGLGSAITGFHVSTKSVYEAPSIARALTKILPPDFIATTWADEFGEFFHAIQLEKTMMFLILLLIIMVAAFNLVATLVMVVNEKQADIAILRTYGARTRTIMGIFIVQGGMIGIVGVMLGVVGGLLLASHVTGIVNWLEHVLHMRFLSSSVYFIDYLPSKIIWQDVLKVSGIGFFLSLLATLYPALRAARLNPVEALRYE